ncbi:FAD-binding oxidoreductase [uncultured Vibrio sp.]|uniref:FAD-binding oxidoreductase n=1 Tax=uncultured Vibrio sp. TaxID=114054 RepID=UPI0009229BEB|nr:FAD-binding oxidoreductase [uncultured Vibrio sp.]OIQ25325.1 MAG: FAD-linked oxidase [Vibrio sp. MedPE-SWchi]
MTELTSWGRYPTVETEQLSVEIATLESLSLRGIPRGLGRSYGDSALSDKVILSDKLSRFISFDKSTGQLRCEAGITIEEILKVFIPKGWFPYVTPGTKFVTIGGAIASDVHGKNHHKEGSFCDYVSSIVLLIDGQLVTCNDQKNSDLFRATCGGMGLTGFIVEATITLKPIKSAYIQQKVIKAENLREAINLLEENSDYTYSVAWIDCLSMGERLGRSLIMIGEHSDNNQLKTHKNAKLSIPFEFPTYCLNQYSVQGFNFLYYHRQLKKEINNIVHYDTFFYPLDGISNWNLIYGKQGFTQYQFVIPKHAGIEALTEIITEIAASKLGSFLAVLKVLKEENENLLSFPIEGYTLALDFKINPSLFPLLNRLDEIVKHFSGRIYLSKDVRMDEDMFKATYPNWIEFERIRTKFNLKGKYYSLQSKRLGL